QALQTYNSVRFTYINRSDVVPSYQAGAVMQTTKLLSHIKTYAGSNVVSDYQLQYNLAASGDEHNELTSVTLCDGSGNCLAPTSFTWQGSRDNLTITERSISVAQAPGEPQV